MSKQTVLTRRRVGSNGGSRKPASRLNGKTAAAELRSALKPTVDALRRLASSKMDPALARRMHELGERKEFLSKKEHDELLRLVDFWAQRLIDKLSAKVALKELRRIMPKLVNGR